MIRRSLGHFCEIHPLISLRFSGCPAYGSKGVGCMLTFGSKLQKKCKINHFCGFQGCHRYLIAPMEFNVVADYPAEATS